MTATDWVSISSAMVLVIGAIATAAVKVIGAVNAAHGTAAKAVAAVVELAREVHPPSDGIASGAVTENTNVALHYFVDMLAAVLKVPAPNIPTPQMTADGIAGATLTSLPVTTNPPRNIPTTVVVDHDITTPPTNAASASTYPPLPPLPPEVPSGP